MATYVLIPGAGGEARYWYRVVAELEARGHVAISVRLPAGDESAGWLEYADAIVAATRDRSRDQTSKRSSAPGELILVAQSLGGFSAPLVCDRLPVDLIV